MAYRSFNLPKTIRTMNEQTQTTNTLFNNALNTLGDHNKQYEPSKTIKTMESHS